MTAKAFPVPTGNGSSRDSPAWPTAAALDPGGSGLGRQSTPEREYEETREKLRSVPPGAYLTPPHHLAATAGPGLRFRDRQAACDAGP